MMLNRNDIMIAVNDAIRRYAEKYPGESGWEREDIENAVKQMGGDDDDIGEAVFLALRTFLGDEIERIRPAKRIQQ